MTDEDQKWWGAIIKAIRSHHACWGTQGHAILAVDAELKRLREALEWAENANTNEVTTFAKAELRRRAKEG